MFIFSQTATVNTVTDWRALLDILYAVDYVLLDIIMSIQFFFIPNPVLSISSLFIRIQPGNTARVSAVQPQDCWLLCQRSDNTNLELSNNCSCRLFILSGWTVFTSCCCSSPVHSDDSNSTMPAWWDMAKICPQGSMSMVLADLIMAPNGWSEVSNSATLVLVGEGTLYILGQII